MNCDFERLDDSQVRCRRCGMTVQHDRTAGRLSAVCRPRRPGLLQQAVTFGKAVVKHAATGLAHVSDVERDRRLQICRGCEQFDAAQTRCNKCACFLNVKARWLSEACPLGKWNQNPPATAPAAPLAGTTRHLMYHIWPRRSGPLGGSTWRWNIEQLARWQGLFNGQKHLAIVTDQHSDTADTVFRFAESCGLTFDKAIGRTNKPAAGEWVTFADQVRWAMRTATGPQDIVFRAHAKGVKHNVIDGLRLWTEAAYSLCLDGVDLAEQLLAEQAFAGPWVTPGIDPFGTRHRWHFPGSFYWFRPALMGEVKDPAAVIQLEYHAAESWPGQWARKHAGNISTLAGERMQQPCELSRVAGVPMYQAANWEPHQAWLQAFREFRPEPRPSSRVLPPPAIEPAEVTPEKPAVAGPAPLPARRRPEGPPKVLFLTPSLLMGGAERWLAMLAEYLPADNLALILANPGAVESAIKRDVERWTPVVECRAENRELLADLYRQAEFIITWGIGDLRPYLQPTQAQIVWVAQGQCDWTMQAARGAEPFAHHFVGVSDACRRVFSLHIQPRMHVLYNTADIKRCVPIAGREATRRKWGLTDDQRAVVYIGRFSHEKRPTAVAEALPHLPANHVGIMVGNGWKETEVRAQVDQLAGDRVRWFGFEPHVGDPLAAADVWVNCSPAEGHSLSLNEAWLAGVPVVSTPTGSIPELQARYGQLVEAVPIGASGAEIAAAIQRAGDAAVVDRARRLAWSEFTGAVMGRKWLEFLLSLRTEGTFH